MNKFHTDKFSIVYLSSLTVTRMRQTTTIHYMNGLTLKNDRVTENLGEITTINLMLTCRTYVNFIKKEICINRKVLVAWNNNAYLHIHLPYREKEIFACISMLHLTNFSFAQVHISLFLN